MADTVLPFPAQQIVAPYEANLIAQADQKRLGIAAPAAELLAGLRAAINRTDHKLSQYSQELAEAWQQAQMRGEQAYAPALPGALYWAGVALLLCLEMALNMAAVEQLRMEPLHAWATAGFIGLMNCLAAKSTARVLRQDCWKSGARSAWLLAVAANIVTVLALHQLARLRAAEAGGASAADAAAFLAVSGDLAAVPAAALDGAASFVSPMVFLLLQLGGYLVVLLLSYFQLDPSLEREQLTKRVARLERRVEAPLAARGDLAKRHNEALARAELALADIVADTHERVFQYRDGNMRSRPGEDLPLFFAHAIAPALFTPIEFGWMVDHHPSVISQIVGRQSQGELK